MQWGHSLDVLEIYVGVASQQELQSDFIRVKYGPVQG